MTLTYTESWNKAFSNTLNDRSVTTELHVVSTSDPITPFNIYTATEYTTGAIFPPNGSYRADNPRYRLHSAAATENRGPRYVVVTCTWQVGKFGGSETEDDPLNAPIQYVFRSVTSGEPVDTAFGPDGRRNVPIVNSAGEPFSQPVTGDYNSYILEAIRNEATFDPALAVAVHNRTNAGVLRIAGKTLQPGEALCRGMFPASGYTLFDEYVPVTYQFEIRERLTLSNGKRVTAFCHRILDRGQQGWITGTDNVKRIVPIYYRNGEVPLPTPVTSDVLLDGGVPTGEPADAGSDYWSVDPTFDPANGFGWEPPTPRKIAPPQLLAIDRDDQTSPERPITWLIYRKYPEADFGGLNL